MGGLSQNPQDFTRVIPRGHSAPILFRIYTVQVRRPSYYLDGFPALESLTECLCRASHKPL